MGFLKEHKRLIAFYAALGSLLLGIYGFFTPRDYVASSRVLLTPKTYSQEASAALIEGQKQVLHAETLLAQVVEEEKLASDKEFGLKQEGVVTSVLNIFLRRAPVSSQERARFELAQALDVRVRDGFTLEIRVHSLEAEKAARLANRVTQSYLEGHSLLGQDSKRAYSARVSSRLEEVSKALRQAEENLYKLKATSSVQEAEGDVSFISNQVAIARAKTAELRERVDKFTKFQRTGGDVMLMIQTLQSPTLETMRQQTLELMRQESELQQTLLPKHPQILALQKQIGERKIALSQEVSRAGNSLKADLETAQTTEKTLAQKLDALRQTTGATSTSAQAVREAEREVETQKTLYTSLLLKSGEPREAGEPLQVSLISLAHKPLTGQGWPLSLWAGLGLFLGGFLGILRALAWKGLYAKYKFGKQRGALEPQEEIPVVDMQGIKQAAFMALSPTQARSLLSLAQEQAQQGKNILLIEGDQKLPLSRLILNQPQAGLCEWLRGEKTLEEVVIYDKTTGLSFLPFGMQEGMMPLLALHVARLKLFSHLFIAAGTARELQNFALLAPQNVLLRDKDSQAAQKEPGFFLRQDEASLVKDYAISGIVYA